MRDTSSAANHRQATDRAQHTNGLGPADDTWFEASPAPPRDTPLIALVPVPREESPSAG